MRKFCGLCVFSTYQTDYRYYCSAIKKTIKGFWDQDACSLFTEYDEVLNDLTLKKQNIKKA